MKVKRFADPLGNNKDFWIELEDGTRQVSDTDKNQEIFWYWVISPNAKQYEENGYLIFEF